MDVVMKCGAHQVFNHNHKSYEKKLMDFTGDEGFDVIIEHLANINLAHDIQMIKKSKSCLKSIISSHFVVSNYV
jgi:hypothetical protein